MCSVVFVGSGVCREGLIYQAITLHPGGIYCPNISLGMYWDNISLLINGHMDIWWSIFPCCITGTRKYCPKEVNKITYVPVFYYISLPLCNMVRLSFTTPSVPVYVFQWGSTITWPGQICFTSEITCLPQPRYSGRSLRNVKISQKEYIVGFQDDIYYNSCHVREKCVHRGFFFFFLLNWSK